MKFGDLEVEWQWVGEVPQEIEQRVTKLLNRFLALLETSPAVAPQVRTTVDVVPSGQLKKTARGGARKASVSRGIDELIKSKWLVEKKATDVADKLRETYPGASAENVMPALRRRLNKNVTRRKQDGEWLWSVIEKK